MHLIPLDGQWEFRNAKEQQWLAATVPGCNYTDLLAHGKIPDPFVGDNETKVQWVAETDWEYRRSFVATEKLLACDRIFLECDGLDTLATVRINGKKVGTSNNMFYGHTFAVGQALKAGRNEIVIRLDAPYVYLKKMEKTEPVRGVGQAVKGPPFMRKAQCQFGWDWGPMLPPSGIWRSIRIVGRDTAKLEDVHFRQQHHGGRVSVSVDVEVDSFKAAELGLRMTLIAPDGSTQVVETALEPKEKRAALKLDVKNPQLWWPNGYGAQPLYGVKVELQDGEGRLLDVWSRRVGLRTLQLSRKKDKFGESFVFVVNGVPIFCKGANWIPADSFPNRVTPQRYRYLLESAAQVHMNMLRVWGGGFYEEDAFYDLCDELGLLVWQDFMFACGVYPTDEAFFENVHGEVTQIVRRLRHRACLALWCGNNEMEQGWCDWGWAQNMPAKSKAGYDRMFHKLMPKWVAAEDTDIAYWPSSPSSGIPFEKPNAEDRGDGHYWGVWHGREPFTAFRKHGFRFQSEFGFQSLPPFETVKTYAAPEDWNMTSRIMEHHQRSGSGNGLIIHYLTQQYRMPKDFESLCYLSQILQAEGIRYGVEFWRRNSERTKGTLYWQIDDCWPVCSWASIDYFGRWKALHYYARRFYAPVLLSGNDEGTKVDLHVTSDLLKPFNGRAEWQLVTFDGEVLKKGRLAVKARPNADTKLKSFDFAGELKDGMARRAAMVLDLFGQDGRRISRGMVSFAPYKHQELPEPKLSAVVVDAGDAWRVTVKAEKLARFVEVRLEDQSPEAIWSDNYFDLPAGGEQTVTLAKGPGETLDRIRSRLRLRSLRETYA
mgnify:CR=1 FL=1